MSGGAPPQEPDIFEVGNVIDDSYVVTSRLGKGGYGEIYKATRLADQVQVAVKVERSSKSGNLIEEQHILETLAKSGCKHIPTMMASGFHEKHVHYFVMELLGENLSVLRRKQAGHTFTLRCTCALAIQMLKGGVKNPREVVIIDYGLSRRYVKPDGSLRSKRKEVRWVGSRRYMSPNTHLRKDQCRRDDLWGFLYVIIELYTGTLPWAHLRGIQNLDKVRDIKLQFANEKLVANLPLEFNNILQHIISLKFYQRPNYRYIHSCLMKMLISDGGTPNSPYDWEVPSQIPNTSGAAFLEFSSIHSSCGFSDNETATTSTQANSTNLNHYHDTNNASSASAGTTSKSKDLEIEDFQDLGKKHPLRFQFLEDSANMSENSSERRRKRVHETSLQYQNFTRANAEAAAATAAAQAHDKHTNDTPKKKKKKKCVIQ